MSERWIGAKVRRREDARLVTGHGRYVADLALPGMLHVAVQRSPHAHARVVRVDAAEAVSTNLQRPLVDALCPTTIARRVRRSWVGLPNPGHLGQVNLLDEVEVGQTRNVLWQDLSTTDAFGQ